jgi:hypothetical protein
MSMPTSSSLGSRGAAGDKIPKGYAAGQLQQFTPEQMDLFKSMFGFAQPGSQLYEQAMGSDKGFAPYENYANRQFQEAQGQLASRFSGLNQGAMSARRGSGFQNLATQGAQDFASQLAMQRQQLQRQALNDLRGLSSELFNQRPQENFLTKKEKPWWQQLLLGANEAGQDFASSFGSAAGKAAFM